MAIGWNDVSKGYVVCPECDGEGKFEKQYPGYGYVVCETCGGAGEVEEEEEEEEG